MRFNVYLGIRVTVEEPSGNPQYAIDQAKGPLSDRTWSGQRDGHERRGG